MNINISINKKSTDKLAFGAKMSVDFVKAVPARGTRFSFDRGDSPRPPSSATGDKGMFLSE